MVVVRCRMEITDLPPETCAEDDAGASEDLRGPSARKQVEASISVRLAPPSLKIIKQATLHHSFGDVRNEVQHLARPMLLQLSAGR